MKKILPFITLNAMVVTATMTISLTPRDYTPEQLEQRGREQAQLPQLLEDAKAGNDDALKEALAIAFRLYIMLDGDWAVQAKILAEMDGLSRERMVNVLDSFIRENMPIVDAWMSDKDNIAGLRKGNLDVPSPAEKYFSGSLSMLNGLPGEDTLALFEKYLALATADVYVRRRLTESYNRTKAIVQSQQHGEEVKPNDDEASNEKPPLPSEEELAARERANHVRIADGAMRQYTPFLDKWLSDKDNADGFKNGTLALPNGQSRRFYVSLDILERNPGEDTLAMLAEYIALTTADNHIRRQLTEAHARMKAKLHPTE